MHFKVRKTVYELKKRLLKEKLCVESEPVAI